jgi:uncharacterized membrane protein YfcA
VDSFLFFSIAVPTVLLIGIAKGGFAGPLVLMGVPAISLIIPPLQASAILLPILVAMDISGLITYRRSYHIQSLKWLLPAALAGVAAGWFMASYITESNIRLVVGIIGLSFVCHAALKSIFGIIETKPGKVSAIFWGTLTGFTSFLTHAGGPTYQIHMMRLRLDPWIFAGTAVIFFSVVNAVKLIPYFLLGQFSTSNLMTSLILLPLAPIGVYIGSRLVKSVSPKWFYLILYIALVPVSIKLIIDGITL